MATNPVDPITAGLNAVSQLAQTFREWVAGSPTRRMRRAIDYGEQYIRTAGPLIERYLPPQKQRTHQEKKIAENLKDLENAFFKNNG